MTYVAIALFLAFLAYALWEGTRDSDNGDTRAGDSTGVSRIGDGHHHGP